MATTQQTSLSRPIVRPYRDFLTPALHRRFTNAALSVLLMCLVLSMTMGINEFAWQWFPITFLRALLLFIPALSIYILRLAQIHVGLRTTLSPFITFQRYALTFNTLRTCFWYSLSSLFFVEIYIWSAPVHANMAMVDPGKSYERSRLNERPIYLRSMFLILALVQTVLHLSFDYDRLSITCKMPKISSNASQSSSQDTSALIRSIMEVAKHSLFTITTVSLLGPISYLLFFRRPAWRWTYAVAKHIFTLPKTSRPPTFPPYLAGLVGHFFFSGFMLLVLWQAVNRSFSYFAAAAPLKKDTPLTSDSSDPNGSLLAGLKAKKELPRNMAFWELAIIADGFATRRTTLFSEIDRKGGSTWSQILVVCLAELQALVARLDGTQAQAATRDLPKQPQEPARTLPKISASIKQDNILSASPSRGITSKLGSYVKSNGQAQGTSVSPRAKRLMQLGTDALLSEQRQEELSRKNLTRQANSFLLDMLHYHPARLLRQTYARTTNSVVLGSPYGNLNIIVNAARALARLATASLKEDKYGRVQSDVGNMIRVYTSTLQSIKDYMQNTSEHWTDVEFASYVHEKGRMTAEVKEVVESLIVGLRSLINEFGEFREDLCLTTTEMRKAKEAVAWEM